MARSYGKAGTYLPREVPGGPPKKIFVGSLPDSITESLLREEFSRYGDICDLYLKRGCERNKQWAFITFATQQEADLAKSSTDRKTKFPGAEVPCEVMLARNQGMNGRDPLRPSMQQANKGPTKIFVGSLPDDISEQVLKTEFSKYGQITDIFLKTGCEMNKQWAFLVFATNTEAQQAKDATDRVLVFPGATQPCEVMFAKSQGKSGQDSPTMDTPPTTPAPPMSSVFPPSYAWRAYQTPQGMTYYYNHATGVSQWECPMELQYSAMAAHQQAAQHVHLQQSHMQQQQHQQQQQQQQQQLMQQMQLPITMGPQPHPAQGHVPPGYHGAYGAAYGIVQPQVAFYRPY